MVTKVIIVRSVRRKLATNASCAFDCKPRYAKSYQKKKKKELWFTMERQKIQTDFLILIHERNSIF